MSWLPDVGVRHFRTDIIEYSERARHWADFYTDCLVRLPLYYELTPAQQQRVIGAILDFYHHR